MCVIIILVIWTTTGTFMLMFLAALQDLPVEIDEAAALDGVTGWQQLRLVTLPHAARRRSSWSSTLGLIGTWQVFDQIYVMGKGAPAGTTLTPAYLSYQQSFRSFNYGTGAAMAFIVFLIIVVLTWLQRPAWTRTGSRRTRRRLTRAASLRQDSTRRRQGASDERRDPPAGRHGTPRRGHGLGVPAGRRHEEAAAYALLVLFAVVFIYPFLIQIATSFKTDPDAADNPLSLVPNPFDLHAWKRIFGLTRGRVGPDAHVAAATRSSSPWSSRLARVFLDSLAGYALSRLQFRGRGFRLRAPSSR